MPYIAIEASKMNKDQKKSLIEGLTKVASDTLKIPPSAFLVIIKENDMDNIGTGGRLLREVMAERSKKEPVMPGSASAISSTRSLRT
jgi:4-oxalocrotonate tautomerase